MPLEELVIRIGLFYYTSDIEKSNVYLIAMPSRIVGNIINYLYDIEANKSLIFAEIARLMSILRFVYYCTNGLEKYRGQDGICFRKAYKRYYVCSFKFWL